MMILQSLIYKLRYRLVIPHAVDGPFPTVSIELIPETAPTPPPRITKLPIKMGY
ncbi:hypothetical protein CC80DRAFT_495064 [Byssothecium circinans]|uniref:Uncharacterized protein n=1 Tax=Byssothecium circinans TaxID=147558 RepID=A0A6A5TMJ9_9PLEO|nr:hypothetical protein CC80DRAFT_495064 [Byssothecium circinans]